MLTREQVNKHGEVIKAWIDGAEVEVKCPYDENRWLSAPYPSFNSSWEYRVKQKGKGHQEEIHPNFFKPSDEMPAYMY